MSQTPLDFLNLFVRSPGDVIFFLGVVALSQAGLFMALSEGLRQSGYRDLGRYTLAFAGIVVTLGVLMLGALYTVVSDQDISTILPPLERAAYVIIMLLVGWAFLTADHDGWGRTPNILLLLLMALVIGGYIVTGVEWLNTPERNNFNLTAFGIAWTFISAAFCLLGVVFIVFYFRLTADAPLKLLFFLILLAGHIVTLVQVSQFNILGSYAGAVRLALLAAFPILPAVIYRMVINHLQGELETQGASQPMVAANIEDYTPSVALPPVAAPNALTLPPSTSAPSISPIQRDSIQLLKTLGLILEDATPGSIPERIVTSGLEVLKADVGAVLTLQDANYADITAAYDNNLKKPLSGLALNLDSQPTLVNAIERRLQRPLYPDRNAEELRDLYNRLDISDVGPAYFQPLTSGKDLIGVLLIGMPTSKRELEEGERELLKGIGIISGNLLSLSYAARDARLKAEERAIQAMVQGVPIADVQDSNVAAARQDIQSSLQASREQISELSKQVTQLRIELDHERSRVASVIGDTEEGLSVSQRILTLTEEQQNLRTEREQLAARLQEAETALAGATATTNESMLNTMIEVLRREKDELLEQRELLQKQIDDLRVNQAAPTTTQSGGEMADRMGQEKDRLESERDQLYNKLADMNSQLKALGIDNGAAGLGQLLGQLADQRAGMLAKIETLTLERTALLNERMQFEESIRKEKEREGRLQVLENEIKHLASDREALTKQRDQIRAERDDLIAKQDAIKQHRARLLAETSGYQIELAEAHQEQARLRAQLQELADAKSDFTNIQNRLAAEKQALETERDMLLARMEGDRGRLQQLGVEGVGSLTKMIEDASEQRNQLERELNESRTLLAAAQNQIDMLQVRTSAIQQTNGEARYESYDPDVLLGMIQELRTPLTSIVGYVDLLLEEAAGILGEMQRKFLQRVASNITRLTFMLDELTRVGAQGRNPFDLSPKPIDIITLIEDAISNATYQFRERGLTVNLNLDNNVPKIRADRDAIGQILQQLLMNAYLASPPNSPISITAHRQPVQLSQNTNLTSETDCLLISVEDRGGGIPQDEISRVFMRKYKTDHPLVQGLGDTGVGLSSAKTLAERHGGGLWLETREGVGSIFYFALPIETSLNAEQKDS